MGDTQRPHEERDGVLMIAAVTMVRDELDVLPSTLAHILDQVDLVFVADNGSIDGTREHLRSVAEQNDRLVVLDDLDPRYLQSEKMTRLAHLAGMAGASWVVPFDADEVWYSPFGRIGDVLTGIAEQWLTVRAPVFDHVATAQDPDVPDPVRRMGWRRSTANPLPKVAARIRPDLVIEQGNHGARFDGGATVYDPVLVVRHFPYRSVEQLVRKVRNGAQAYRAAGDELPSSMGAHWRQWGDLLDAQGEEAIADLFRTWYWRDDPTTSVERWGEILEPLLFDPAPIS